jgi:DNA-binding NarL/FixJ family response regulator
MTARASPVVERRLVERGRLRLLPARLLVADEQLLTRLGLRAVVAEDSGLQVVGETSSGLEVVGLARATGADLVVMDERMPGLDTFEVIRQLRQARPTTSVLILTLTHDSDVKFAALRAGAAGYVVKSRSAMELRAAIWDALDGALAVDHLPTRNIDDRRASAAVPMGYSRLRHDPLSARELEVLPLLAQGLSNPEIAGCLTISNHTVKSHIEHILAKLGVSDRTHAAVRAIELGYLKVGGDQESPMATCSTCAMPEQLGNYRRDGADSERVATAAAARVVTLRGLATTECGIERQAHPVGGTARRYGAAHLASDSGSETRNA